MILLGLDPSFSNMGYCLIDTLATGPESVIERGRFQTSPKMVFVDRYIHQREKLRELLQRYPECKRIGQESPVFGADQSEGLYGLFIYCCEATRAEKRDFVLLSPGQLKAHAREFIDRPPKWKMEKPDMIEAAKTVTQSKGNWPSDEADAYWAARVAGRWWHFFDGDLDWDQLTPLEQTLIAKQHTFLKGKKAGKTVKSGLQFRENSRFFQWSK